MSTFLMVITSLFAFIVIPILFLMTFVMPAKLNLITNKHPTGKITRKKFLLGLLAGWIISVAISAIASQNVQNVEDKSEPVKTDELTDSAAVSPVATADKTPVVPEPKAAIPTPAPAKSEVSQPKQVAKDKTFGITPNEFGKRFLKQAKDVGLGDDTQWNGNFDIKEGTVNDVFMVLLSDALAMNGTVDKNGELKSLTYVMGKTDKGDQEAMSLLVFAGLSARALSPDLPKEKTAGIVTKLFTEAASQFGEHGKGEASQVVDGVKYSITAGNGLGLWVSFEAV